MNRTLGIGTTLAIGVAAFVLYVAITELFTAATLRHALLAGAIVGVVVFAIALALTRMIGSFDSNID